MTMRMKDLRILQHEQGDSNGGGKTLAVMLKKNHQHRKTFTAMKFQENEAQQFPSFMKTRTVRIVVGPYTHYYLCQQLKKFQIQYTCINGWNKHIRPDI